MESINKVTSSKSTQGLALVTDSNGVINESRLSDVKITLLKNVTRPSDFSVVPLCEVLESIRSGQYQKEIDVLRGAYQENRKQYTEGKLRLPSVCFSGVFNGSARNNNFTHHSGIFIVDIDDLSVDAIGSIKQRITQIRYIVFVFVSPSGVGLKVGVHISKVSDGQAYKECFNSVKTLFEEICAIDESGKDVSRKCFVSHDPDMYVNYSAIVFEPVMSAVDVNLYSEKALPPVSRNIDHRVFPSKGVLPLDVLSALNSINPDCDYTDWLAIGMAVHNASDGSIEGFQLWDSWSMQGESYPDAIGETRYKWESFSGYNETPITVRTLYKKAYESGWEGLGYSELVELTTTLCADDIDRTTDVIELMGKCRLTPIEVDSLLKKIKQKTSWSMGALRESFKNDRSGSCGNDQMKIFREVRSAIGDDNLIFAQSWFYKWNESGVWEKLEDIYISQRLQTHCDNAGYSYTASVIESSKKLMANSSYLKGHIFDQCSNVINCLSGELHFIGNKWELKEFDKLSYRTTQIRTEYDRDADCPRYKQFLDEVFEGEPDKEARKTLLLEMMGYSLIQSTDYEKFMILTGVGANGKSVVLNILIAMLGQRQVSGVRPTQLDNKFQVAHLHGKLANVVTELPEGAVLRDSEIKGISSGELMTAEHKNKDPFDFSPFATLWMATNHMPHCRDHSNAIYRRAEVLSFNREFKGDKADTDLSNKLIKELPGIFKMATDAIAGVFITGQFTHCPSSEKAKSSWRLESDQVMQFLADEYEEVSGETVLLKDVFNTYKHIWVLHSGTKHTYGRNKFYQRLKELGCTVKDTNHGDALVGYRIKPTET